ncbi:MAG: oligopeptidase A [Lentisphaeraceae bacterium]|nr:oligopeptidase A [Lentisphaeraceae bacterium]
MSNPLLEEHLLPPFSKIKVEHIVPAIEKIIADNEAKMNELLENCSEPTWENTIEPLEELDRVLSDAWSPVGHMNSVVNSPELREAYEKCLPVISEYSTKVGQNKKLYEVYKKLLESADFESFPQARKKIITAALRDFKLSGIALPEDKQKRYGELKKKLSELSSKFSNNVLDATMAWTKNITDENELKGIPENAMAGARQAAKAKDLEGWLFTLDYPSFGPVMTYCENREFRREIYEAFTTRASDKGPYAGKFDNSEIMEEILKLRGELAKLLDFNNYAELSIATKMAGTTDEVLGFLNNLADRSIEQGKEEIAEIKKFAADELGISDLNSWDSGFAAEKLRQKKYDFSQEELRPYLAADRVTSGMFEVVKRLYGITLEKVEGIDLWHPDVRFYKVMRDGEQIASFYLDLFAREHKRGGAWMDVCRSRISNSKVKQLPVAYLVCNFTAPVGDKPALITHNEVTTLFHEFGHGLHHMLTQVNELSASGISGVAWDAVELPSQFMENWCWEREGLDLIAEHFESGEKIPEEMIEKLLAAKNFGAGMAMLRQLELGLFDFEIHTNYGSDKFKGIQETLDSVRERVSVLKAPDFNSFQHGFAHIFAGGYAAGYYSYKWAEVLSADAYSKFEENGIFDRNTGLEFLDSILSKGGSADAAELFIDFRGRPPKIDALLRHCGIKG